jgi:ABC-2 type transport system ATP-binding protein
VPALVIRDLVVRHGDRAVVDGFNLIAEAGQITALIGPNGAGKTTTVEVCVGLRRRSGGQVTVLGTDPRAAGPDQRAAIGVMLQTGGLYPTTTAVPWLTALSRLTCDSKPVGELVEELRIPTSTTVRRMSGGEVQRLKLAGALIGRPQMLFLDEPTAALDPRAKESLLTIIRTLRDDGVCVVLTTHDMTDVEAVADQVTVMSQGRSIAAGPVSELTGTGEGMHFRTKAGLRTETLLSALPVGYRVNERSPGDYVIHGTPSPQIMSTVMSWCAEHGVMATEIRTGTQTLSDLLREIEMP